MHKLIRYRSIIFPKDYAIILLSLSLDYNEEQISE
jgi:hypothetical protein